MSIQTLTQAIELGRLDGAGQARLVRTLQVSAEELIEATNLRIEHSRSALNAVCWAGAAPHPRGQSISESLLFAAPVLLKDSLDCIGLPSRAGSRARGLRPAATEYAFVGALRGMGVAIVGKTSMPEFGLLPSNEPLLYGATRNPWNSTYSPGGSSGGAAAAVAAGLVPLAHASDGAGSIRIPASCCGVFGFKPSRGANYAARAAHPIEDLICSDSLITRSVRDAAYSHALLGGSLARAQGAQHRPLRIGLTFENLLGEPPDGKVRDATQAAARLCEALGHAVVPIPQPFDGRRIMVCIENLWGRLGAEALFGISEVGSDEALLEPWTIGLARWGASRPPAQALLKEVQAITGKIQSNWPAVDVLLTPALKRPPLKTGELGPEVAFETLLMRMFDYVSYTPVANIAGLPSMSVPLYWTDENLPIGALFTARRGDDAPLFALARQLEEAAPWVDRWPPVYSEN